jgi:hypothetical protein
MPVERPGYEREVAALGASLGDEAFAAGRAMSPEQAFA